MYLLAALPEIQCICEITNNAAAVVAADFSPSAAGMFLFHKTYQAILVSERILLSFYKKILLFCKFVFLIHKKPKKGIKTCWAPHPHNPKQVYSGVSSTEFGETQSTIQPPSLGWHKDLWDWSLVRLQMCQKTHLCHFGGMLAHVSPDPEAQT